MLIESQSLLATLLSHPLPSDTLLLSQPVLCLSPERESEIACMIVRGIIEAGVRLLIMRKQNLSDALVLENDALIVLQSLQPVREYLEQSQKEIMNGMRAISKKLSDLKTEMLLLTTNTVETFEFKLQNEHLLILQEDINASTLQMTLKYQYQDELLQFIRIIIKSIPARDWVEYGKLFTGKTTSKINIYLMYVNQLQLIDIQFLIIVFLMFYLSIFLLLIILILVYEHPLNVYIQLIVNLFHKILVI